MEQENNQLQKKQEQNLGVAYKPNLKNALQVGDKVAITNSLRAFKGEQGALNYPAIFSIPTDQRLAKMSENDFPGTLAIVTAGVTLAMESLNLKFPMNALQIVDLAEAIIDTAGEDNLSLEDLMLFLQNLTRGKYNPLYESMDVPKFMGKFEIYREERHQAMVEYRENKHLAYKALGDPSRTTKPETAFEQHLSEYATKLQIKTDEIKELKAEKRRNHERN